MKMSLNLDLNMNLNHVLNVNVFSKYPICIYEYKYECRSEFEFGSASMTRAQIRSQGPCRHPVLEDLVSIVFVLPRHGCGARHALASSHQTRERVVLILSVAEQSNYELRHYKRWVAGVMSCRSVCDHSVP
jgi:hypothetical protein